MSTTKKGNNVFGVLENKVSQVRSEAWPTSETWIIESILLWSSLDFILNEMESFWAVRMNKDMISFAILNHHPAEQAENGF